MFRVPFILKSCLNQADHRNQNVFNKNMEKKKTPYLAKSQGTMNREGEGSHFSGAMIHHSESITSLPHLYQLSTKNDIAFL